MSESPAPRRWPARRSGTVRLGVTRLVALATVVASGAGLAAVALSGPAAADTVPPVGTPATVSADALPTAQVNGVVWAQVTVGDTVWATGKFTQARPPGVAAGGAGSVNAANLVAFSVSTGQLRSAAFVHSLNAQGLAITASPDGTKVYVGGDFTTVDGQSRPHLAAFSTLTGALDPTFRPNVNSTVQALQANATTVYVGGNFGGIGGASRLRLGAVNATTGAVLPWAPTADDRQVTAMVLTPDQSTVIVGGHFTTLNHVAAYGLGSLNATTGALQPFPLNAVVRDAGKDAAITSLTTDGSYLYGTGYVFGAGGNLEGAFSATFAGAVRWVEDCHGDTYGVLPLGAVTYTVGHAHACPTVGGFPQTNPWVYKRGMAWTTAPVGTVAHNQIGGYADWFGKPAPQLLQWWPTLSVGTFTGQSQAAWSLSGNASYLVLGGEFPKVNGVAQQGLVRFAVPAIAPNKVGAQILATTTPTLTARSGGSVTVSWKQTWDQDNQNLTYSVLRDGGTTPIYSTTSPSVFWSLNSLSYNDSGLVGGSTHTYRIRVTDPRGNFWSTPWVSVTVPAKAKLQAADTEGSFRAPSGPTGTDLGASALRVKHPGS